MNYQEKQKRKRKAAAVIALLVILAMVASLVTPFLAYAMPVAAQTTTVVVANGGGTGTAVSGEKRETEFGQERFTLEAEAGFDGEYIVGKPAALRGVITNHGAAFRGELQAKVYLYEETSPYGNTAEYAVYYQEMELLEGASQKIDMELNMGTIRRFLQVTLVDEKGDTVFLQNIRLQANAPETLAIGILSERPQDMRILAGMKPAGLRKEDESLYRAYFFDGENFPDSRALMKNFRVIVADGIDMAALSEKQRDALTGWVRNGGLLMLGTGETAERALGGLEMTAGIRVDGSSAAESLRMQPGGARIPTGTPVTLATLSGEGLEPLWQEDGTVFAYRKKEGAGSILLPAFSLCTPPTAMLAETPEMLWNLCRMANEAYMEPGNGGQNVYYSGRYGSFPPLGMGTVRLLMGLLAAYVLISGPLTYLILKKLDKREKGWVVVPALAVVFMAGIFAVSRTSPYGKGMMRLLSTVELRAGAENAEAKTVCYLKSANAGSVTYRNEEPLDIAPGNTDDYYYYYGLRNETGTVSCTYKQLSGSRTEITFFGNESWGSNLFTAESTTDTGGALESTLWLADGRISGTVTNGTNTGFVDTLLYADGIWLRIGPIQAGETVEIDQPATLDGTDAYDLFNRLFYNDYRNGVYLRDEVQAGRVSREEAFRVRSEQQMLENRLNHSDGAGSAENGELRMEFYGFSEAPVLENTGKINGKEPFVSALTMYHQTFATELAKLEAFDTPFGITAKRVETEETYEWNDRGWGTPYFMLTRTGEAEFVYGVPEETAIELFQFAELEDIGMLTRDPEIYRVSTGEWEPLLWTEYTTPEEYISAEGEIRLRMELREYYDMQLPGMRVKGSGLLAGN